MQRKNVNSDRYYDYPEDNENDELVDSLKDKVTGLKFLALDMGDEIKYQNSFLNGMTSDFENSTNYLSKAFNKVKKISNSGYNRYILYLILFSFFIFFMIYIIIRFR